MKGVRQVRWGGEEGSARWDNHWPQASAPDFLPGWRQAASPGLIAGRGL